MSKTRWLVVGALAATLLAGGSTAAMASTTGGQPTGNPTPSWTPPPNPGPRTCADTPVQFGPTWNWNWGHHRDRRCQQQEFDIQFSSLFPADANGDGALLGTGPLAIGKGGIDVTGNNPFVDTFQTDSTGANSFQVRHDILRNAVIDRVTCSITFSNTDTPWFIVPGSGRGIFAGAIGNGFYTDQFMFSYPTVRNRCTLSPFLTPALAQFLINFRGGAGLPTPLAFGGDVQAVGLSFVPKPKQVWEPTTGPTGGPSA